MFRWLNLVKNKLSLHSKPWFISTRIEHMMAKRAKYLNKFNRTKNIDMEYLYKTFRNKVVTEIRERDYYAQYFAKHKSV